MGKSAGHGQVRHPQALGRQFVGKFYSQRLQVNCWNTPFVHHGPGAHSGAAGSAIDGEEVDLGLGAPAHCHSQFGHGVSACLEGNTGKAEFP